MRARTRRSRIKAHSLLKGFEKGLSSLSEIFMSVTTYVLVTRSPNVCFFLVPAQIKKPSPRVIMFRNLARLRIKAMRILSGFSSLSKTFIPTRYFPMLPLSLVLSIIVFKNRYKDKNIRTMAKILCLVISIFKA